MAFSIGYVGICQRDIQHLYSIRTLKPPPKRKILPYKPGFLNDLDADRKLKLRNRPFMEYNATHDIEIPKAPSFRTAQSEEVDEIVNRLTMSPKKRFNFKYTDHLRYNDWRTAHVEKIQHLRETVSKFGGGKGPMAKKEDIKVARKEKRRKKSLKHEGEEPLPEI